MSVCEKILYFSISITFLDERVPGFSGHLLHLTFLCFVFLSLTWQPGCHYLVYVAVVLSVSEFKFTSIKTEYNINYEAPRTYYGTDHCEQDQDCS